MTDEHLTILAQTLLQLPIYGKINLQSNSFTVRGLTSILLIMQDHLSKIKKTGGVEDLAELREVNIGPTSNPQIPPTSPVLSDLNSYSEILTYLRMRCDMRECFKLADVHNTKGLTGDQVTSEASELCERREYEPLN